MQCHLHRPSCARGAGFFYFPSSGPLGPISTARQLNGAAMANKKPRFSVEEHDRIGRELQIFDIRLCALATKIDKAYPRNEKAYGKAIQAREAIRLLCSDLANLVCKENFGNKDINTHRIYDRMGTEGFEDVPDFDAVEVSLAKRSVD